LRLQESLSGLRATGDISDVALLLEHPHTYTLGKRGSSSAFPAKMAELEEDGVSFHIVDRGGDVTYHGPGQLVCYPIMDLKERGLDLKAYVRDLEQVIIRSLRMFDISGRRLEGFPGVWVGEKKIAAIGIKVDKRGIASHGFALNVHCDLGYFSLIVPCGLKGKGVTSMLELLGSAPKLLEVSYAVVRGFQEVFQVAANLSIAEKSSSGFKGFAT
jgi:lipoate-protein ligase B